MKKYFIIFLITIILTSCSKKKIEGIYDNPGYAIGKITYSTTIGLTLTYHYDFDVSGTEYEGKDNPDDNVIDYDYLIESEDDFEDLLVELETNPPKP